MNSVATEYKETKIGLLPKDWEVKKAKYIFENYTDKNHNGDLEVLAVTQDRGVVPRGSLEIDIKSSEASIKTYKKVEKGNFIISLRSFQGGIEYSDIEGIVSPAYTVLKSKIEISDIFYKYLLKKEDFISRLNSAVIGIREGKQISYSDFSELYLQIPTLKEQEKIAEILSTCDLTVEKQEQLIEKKKEFKKGLMQRLLSGEVRFKEFKDEWKVVKLGDYLIKHNEKSEYNNQYPVLTSSRKGIFLQSNYYSGNDVASEDTTGYNVVPRGYFTYRHMSDDLIFKFNINDIVDNGIVSTLYPVFTVKNMDSYFLRTKLNEGEEFKRFALEQKQGGSRTYMYFSKLETLKLKIPALEEQLKISEVLKAADEEIELLEKELKVLKLQKKGLMQRLLTGEVRVKV